MAEYALPKSNLGVNCLFVAAVLIAFAGPFSLGQTGSTNTKASSAPANAPYVATMTFDVASVRENKDIDMHAGYTMGGQFVPHTATLRVTNWAIEDLISLAYSANRYQIVNAPQWPWPTLFVIEAKGDSEADAKGDEGGRRLQPGSGQGRAEAGGAGLDAADCGGERKNWVQPRTPALPNVRREWVRLHCAWVRDGPVGRDADSAVWTARDR
jgi:hypothetical protein